MLISRIKIANHSRIADLDVEIRGHAVIIGASDVGKTSILRLADMLLEATTRQLYQRLGLADLAEATSIAATRSQTRSCTSSAASCGCSTHLASLTLVLQGRRAARRPPVGVRS